MQPNDKPEWLAVLEKNLMQTVCPMYLNDEPQTWRHIKAYIDSNIRSSRDRGLVVSEKVVTRQVIDGGVTAIHLFRGNEMMAVFKLM